MEKDESPISSTMVSMGMMPRSDATTPISGTKPWVLLVAGDFGFKSQLPEKVSAARWNDFFSTHNSECVCTVEKNLPSGMQPFFLEYTINSLLDFSLGNIIERVPILHPYKMALSIVQDLKSSKISLEQAYENISRLSILETTRMAILQGLGNSPVRNAPSSNPIQIDSILSMLDLGDTDDQETNSPPITPSDTLISEIALADTTPDYQKIYDLLATILNQIAEAIQQTPRFKTLAQSWYSLKNLVKIAGRNRSLIMLVVSCPTDDAKESLIQSLNFCSDSAETPDIVLWDYQYPTTTSSLQLLEGISTIADRYKTLLITSIEKSDPLTADIHSQLPIRRIMERDEMIPYRRLRSSEACRSCVLGISPAYESSTGNKFNESNAAWLITAQWIYSVVENEAPFQWPTQIQSLAGFAPSAAIDHDRFTEVSTRGFTLSQNPAQGYSVPPVVVWDTGGESPYCSAGFNILVNRTARLSAEWFSENSSSDATDQKASALHKFLISQLKPYHILSDDLSISIEIKNGVATIDLNSDISIDSYSVHFQFTLET